MLNPMISDVQANNTPWVDPHKLAALLGLTQAEFADLLHVSRSSLAKPASQVVQKALSPLVKILAVVTEMSGDANHAALWMRHHPIPGLNYKTPLELIAAQQADAVLLHLDLINNGVYS